MNTDALRREDKDGGAVTLVIADGGLKAIGVEAAGEAETAASMDEPAGRKQSARSAGRASVTKPETGAAPMVRPSTKQAMLIDLLRASDGATIDEIIATTGWQAHSVRGAISGTLKKKLGMAVIAEKVDGRGQVYRIAGQR